MPANQDKLHAAFRQGLGLPAAAPVEGLAYRELKEWDSVAHMQLVAAIEATFDIMLDTAEVIGMSSYAVACDIVRRHGVDLEA